MLKAKLVSTGLLFIFFTLTGIMNAQSSGSIKGKITDAGNNEELIGANVVLNGTHMGASTDIQGFYEINNIIPGTYDIRISYISYETITLENINITEGKELIINAALKPAASELNEVIVTAEALKSSEISVINTIKNSGGIADGVSADLISRSNCSDGADVLKSMTGIVVTDGKYAVIRGVGDRYNNTLLNGAKVPGTDPEKKSFSYDLFPASLIENIITSKTYSPDKPADYSGGLVQINTVEFPPGFFFDVSTSSKFNTQTSGKEFLRYSGGNKDYLGVDDGTRSIPHLINGNKVVRGNYSESDLKEITGSFKNNWKTSTQNAPVNGSFKMSLGDKLYAGDNGLFGYVSSFTYSNSSNRKDFEQRSYAYDGERYNYTGAGFSNSVEWGGLLNLSYKIGSSDKISFKNIYNRNADDEIIYYSGSYPSASQFREVTNLRYVTRSLFSSQLLGEHQFALLRGTGLEWNLSYSRSDMDEPDARRYIYSRDLNEPQEPLRFQLDQSLATRYYGNLLDQNLGVNASFNFKFSDNPLFPKLKTGFAADTKHRDFNARTFGFRNIPGGNFMQEDSILQLSVDRIFQTENMNNKFIEVTEITKPSDSYTSNQNIYAAFIMLDVNLLANLRVNGGFRNERSAQTLNSFSQSGEAINIDETYSDWLPGLNIIYSPAGEMQIRFGYSKTLARPEFRELAPFSYFDFAANELVIGNQLLKKALIQNYDVRFELFPGAGELAALGFFYKKFTDPIEQILIASSSFEPVRSFENGQTAHNYGVEAEVRKSLSFLSDYTENLSFTGNISLIRSEIKLTNTGFQDAVRRMQGQADYILNLGLYYDDYEAGFNSSIVFNKIGHKIDKVGYAGLGDIIELPGNQLDFSVAKKIFSQFNLKLAVKNLLDSKKTLVQRTPDGDKISELERTGRTFSAGISFQFN